MYFDTHLNTLWYLTKPSDAKSALVYKETLKRVFALAKKDRFRKPFYRGKKSGGRRRIVPAQKDLVFIQMVLAEWFAGKFDQGLDTCHTGHGVLSAVKVHQKAKCALVVDLKSAFDHVTGKKLHAFLRSRLARYTPEVRILMVDLLTYENSTPQGCVSTPFVFNAVMAEVDREIAEELRSLPVCAITRYVDNICISFTAGVDLFKVEQIVRRIINAHDFEVSWSLSFNEPPFVYLGTRISESQLELDIDKLSEYEALLREAITSSVPNTYKRQITGILMWVYRVYAQLDPGELNSTQRKEVADFIRLFQRYYQKGRSRAPEQLDKLVTLMHNLRMF